jgi:hypothetical protein
MARLAPIDDCGQCPHRSWYHPVSANEPRAYCLLVSPPGSEMRFMGDDVHEPPGYFPEWCPLVEGEGGE